jgi:hypothetical protein
VLISMNHFWGAGWQWKREGIPGDNFTQTEVVAVHTDICDNSV